MNFLWTLWDAVTSRLRRGWWRCNGSMKTLMMMDDERINCGFAMWNNSTKEKQLVRGPPFFSLFSKVAEATRHHTPNWSNYVCFSLFCRRRHRRLCHRSASHLVKFEEMTVINANSISNIFLQLMGKFRPIEIDCAAVRRQTLVKCKIEIFRTRLWQLIDFIDKIEHVFVLVRVRRKLIATSCHCHETRSVHHHIPLYTLDQLRI